MVAKNAPTDADQVTPMPPTLEHRPDCVAAFATVYAARGSDRSIGLWCNFSAGVTYRGVEVISRQ